MMKNIYNLNATQIENENFDFSKSFRKHTSTITKGGGIVLLFTGIAILTGQLQVLGFFILEYFPSLGNIG